MGSQTQPFEMHDGALRGLVLFSSSMDSETVGKRTARSNAIAKGVKASAIFAVLLVVPFLFGLAAVGAAKWPYDPDAYRDIAQAQVILDGEYPADYLLKGETTWYNPLTAFLVAAGSRLTGLPPNVMDVRLGPYLNLLVPICFFALVWVWCDASVALAAAAACLFLVQLDRPTFASATYSPWLFAPTLAQAFFYLGVLAQTKAWKTGRLAWHVVTGILLGVTFLAHTTPAVLLGCIILACAVWSMIRPAVAGSEEISRGGTVLRFSVAMIVAFIVGLPFTISILFNYGLRIVNPEPAYWVYEYLSIDNLDGFLIGLVSLPVGVALAGGYYLLRDGRRAGVGLMLTFWFSVASLFLAWSFLQQAVENVWGLRLPQIAPGYHFLPYLTATRNVLIGVAVVYTARALGLATSRKQLFALPPGKRIAHYVLCVAVMAAVVYQLSVYRSWRELEERAYSISRYLEDEDNPYHWMREHSNSSDVFLCNDMLAIHVVAPSGSKSVASESLFSNIYTSWTDRDAARTRMFDALARGDREAFAEDAAKYEVTYVLLTPDEQAKLQPGTASFLSKRFEGFVASVFAYERK